MYFHNYLYAYRYHFSDFTVFLRCLFASSFLSHFSGIRLEIFVQRYGSFYIIRRGRKKFSRLAEKYYKKVRAYEKITTYDEKRIVWETRIDKTNLRNGIKSWKRFRKSEKWWVDDLLKKSENNDLIFSWFIDNR